MTWTSAFGRACGVLLDTIVRWLALARINPNVLTFFGLVINTVAAFLFGYANGDNQRIMFFYAGLVIIGSGFFDLVDGRVAVLRPVSLLRSRQPIFLCGFDGVRHDQLNHGELYAGAR